MKKCPYCAEEIQDEAIVCKHCGRDLVEEKWRAYCAWYSTLTPEQQRAALRQLTPEKRSEAERAWKLLGYSQSTSSPAAASPPLGAVAPTARRWWVGLLAFIGVSVLALVIFGREDEPRPPAEAVAPDPQAERRLAEARKKNAATDLADLAADAPLSSAAKVCVSAVEVGVQLSKTQANRCQGVFIEWVEEAIAAGNLKAANWRLNAASRVGPTSKAVERLQKRLLERELDAASDAEETGRRAYAEALREKFLDAGLDIKVRATGAPAERLELTFVLFNDVWTHRFQKDGFVAQWQAMGFKRVDAKDGFGSYHVYWNL